jgi:AraC-like DNA-binding protein
MEPVSEAVTARPNGPLSRFVLEHHGYRQRGVQPARHLGMRNVRAGRPNVAGVAAECGYFDQAHLVRDWQQFTGLAPTAWIEAEFRNFQATAAYEPAASAA